MAQLRRVFVPVVLMLLAGIIVAGCNILGAIAAKAPRPDIDAAYKGLANQTVGIMVDADRSLIMDWPNLPLDMANSVNYKIKEAEDGKSKDVAGVTFPYPAASYVKYQKEHPALQAQPITAIAPKLGISRLIYIEVADFSSRSDNGVALFLGKMNCTLKIIEVKDGVAKLAFEENNILIQFPEHAPKEGVLNMNDRAIYAGSLDAMTTSLVKRLIQHPDDSENRGG